MNQPVGEVVGAGHQGYFPVVSREHLAGLEDDVVEVGTAVSVVVDLVEVDCGDPRIGVDDGENDMLWVDSEGEEKIGFEVLGAPTDVGSFAFLLVPAHVVDRVSHQLEKMPVFFYNFLRLGFRIALMRFHGQKHHNSTHRLRMLAQPYQSLFDDLLIFLVIGDDNCVVEGFGGRVHGLVLIFVGKESHLC